MKITAKKREDILRDKAAYEADKANRQVEYNEQKHMYNEAKYAVAEDIKSAIESALGNHADEVRINVQIWDNIEVSINNGDDPLGPSALSWNWGVKLDKNGDVIKDSGSWSGLSAVTAEQIQDLRNTADILEILNNIEWNTLLNTKVPTYDEYVTINNPSYETSDRDYARELKEVDIEDIIGDENAAVFVGKALPDYFKGNEYVSILKETPKRFNVVVFHESHLDRWRNGEDIGYNAVIDKDKFYRFVDTSDIVRR